MDLLLDRLIDGFNNGVIYGFLGLAFVCVYRGSGHLNMAQGEMAMFSGFVAYTLYQVGFPVVGAVVASAAIAFLSVLAAVLAALWFLFYRTRVGLAMRTATSNPESAQLVGIRVSRMSALGWGMAGFIGALIGSLLAPSTTLTTGMMFNFLIYAVVAATLGGFDSPPGVVIAGIAIGVFENLVASYVSLVGSDLKQAVALVAMLVVLMVRPYGLFGTPKVERV
jgi:branched-chain amino acid transport system permease protein